MIDPTAKFILFAVISAGGLLGGYMARRRGWLDEKHSRTSHLITLVALWSPVFFLGFWRLEINFELALIMLLQPVFMLIGWAAMAAITRSTHFSVGHRGVLVISAAITNQGITLGAYLCFVLFMPGEQAMSYAIAYVTSMVMFMVIIFYPVAHLYELRSRRANDNRPDTFSYGRMMKESFISIRALALYAALAGAILSQLHLPRPKILDEPLLNLPLLLAGSFGAYFGNGLVLRLGDSSQYIKHHIVLALVKFAIVPALFIVILLCLLPSVGLGLNELPKQVLLLSAFMPTGMNSVIIANLFHLDARMASSLWMTNTLAFCVIVLPIILFVI